MSGLFRKHKAAPFDDIAVKPVVDDTMSATNVLTTGRDGFSFRGSVFTTTVIISFCWIFALSVNTWLSLAVLLSYILIWGLLFRLFENRSIACVNLFLNVLLAAVPCAFFHELLDEKMFYMIIPVILGVTTLGICPADGRQMFSPYPIGIYFKNIILSVICTCIPEIIIRYIASNNIFIRIVTASLMVMLISYIEGKFLGTQNLLSGRSLSGSSVLPRTEYSTLITFVSGRLLFAGISLTAFGVAMGTALVTSGYFNLNPVCIRAIMTTLVFTIWMLVSKNTKMPFEAFIAITLFARSDTLITYLLVIALDILFKGYITVTRRKSIFHTRNKYCDGIPLMLMTISVFVMVAECCL